MLLHPDDLARLLCVSHESVMCVLRGLGQSADQFFCPLVVEHLPVEMAEVVDVREKCGVSVPSVTCNVALAAPLLKAVRGEGLAHAGEQALAHPERQLNRLMATSDLRVSDIRWQLWESGMVLMTLAMQSSRSPCLSSSSEVAPADTSSTRSGKKKLISGLA